MNLSITPQTDNESHKYFIFIFNRFKCKTLKSKTAHQVHETEGDFQVAYTNYEELRAGLKTALDKLLAPVKADVEFSKKRFVSAIWRDLEAIVDDVSCVKFLISLINVTGIGLKAFSKVFFNNEEYFFSENKIIKYPMKEHVFFHNKEEPFEVVWERTFYDPKKNPRKKFHDQPFGANEFKSQEINSFEDFYNRYKEGRIKKDN